MLPSIFGENLFDEFFANPFGMVNTAPAEEALYGKHSRNLMKTDVREMDNSYELDVDLPGFKKDEITVDLKNGYLTIGASKGLDKEEKDGKYIRRERYAGVCSRSFYVGTAVRPEEIGAKYEDGILKLSVPKAVKKELPASTSISIQ
ncbi:MAG: Hsp20/alpha crystallin family protein [Clostridiales bacterium]|nr:Hsp20/alpha crystallin family protein [Clostridiales bacterium]MCI6434889.1 Hsp20/alpha crystallin family protein [Clostridiales bacterium]